MVSMLLQSNEIFLVSYGTKNAIILDETALFCCSRDSIIISSHLPLLICSFLSGAPWYKRRGAFGILLRGTDVKSAVHFVWNALFSVYDNSFTACPS